MAEIDGINTKPTQTKSLLAKYLQEVSAQLDYLKIAAAIFEVTKDEKNQATLNGMQKVVKAMASVYLRDKPEYYREYFEYACFTGRLSKC